MDRKAHVLNPSGHIVNPRSHVISPKGHILNPRSDVISPRGHILNPRSDIISLREHILNPRSDVLNPSGHILNPRGLGPLFSILYINTPGHNYTLIKVWILLIGTSIPDSRLTTVDTIDIEHEITITVCIDE